MLRGWTGRKVEYPRTNAMVPAARCGRSVNDLSVAEVDPACRDQRMLLCTRSWGVSVRARGRTETTLTRLDHRNARCDAQRGRRQDGSERVGSRLCPSPAFPWGRSCAPLATWPPSAADAAAVVAVHPAAARGTASLVDMARFKPGRDGQRPAARHSSSRSAVTSRGSSGSGAPTMSSGCRCS